MRNYEKDLELVYHGCEKDCMNCELGKSSQCARYKAYERLKKSIQVLRQYVDFVIDCTNDYDLDDYAIGAREIVGVITLKCRFDEKRIEVCDEEEIMLLQEMI